MAEDWKRKALFSSPHSVPCPKESSPHVPFSVAAYRQNPGWPPCFWIPLSLFPAKNLEQGWDLGFEISYWKITCTERSWGQNIRVLLSSQRSHKRRWAEPKHPVYLRAQWTPWQLSSLFTRGTLTLSEHIVHKRKEDTESSKKRRRKEEKKKKKKKGLHLICPSNVQKGVFLSTFFTL